MAKRSADKELTHDNWDQEQEEEEAGNFRIASQEILDKREIRTAKRRGVTGEKGGAGALRGFSFGYSATTTEGLVSKPFTFTTQPIGSTSKTAFGGFTGASVGTSAVTSTTAPAAASVAAAVAKISSLKSSSGDPTAESQYRCNLRALNESVLLWIDNHVKTNPYCILTPIFNDYENYIKELDRDVPLSSDKVVGKMPVAAASFSFSSSSVGASSTVVMSSCSSGVSISQTSASDAVGAGLSGAGNNTANSEGKPIAAATSTTAVATGFKFGAQDSKASTGFSFGSQPSKEATPLMSGFTFGNQPSKEPTTVVPGFSFGAQTTKESSSTSAAGFGFNNQSAKEATSSSASTSAPDDGGEDENDVPPKPEVVDIKEGDAFYTIRCKLYFKINNEFKERGLGNLYLKPCGEKTQLLVRAATTLGNILLNIRLNKSIPTSRQGNNVTMMCIPNPPVDEKNPEEPVCMLIRVKTAEDAETLLKQINDRKV